MWLNDSRAIENDATKCEQSKGATRRAVCGDASVAGRSRTGQHEYGPCGRFRDGCRSDSDQASADKRIEAAGIYWERREAITFEQSVVVREGKLSQCDSKLFADRSSSADMFQIAACQEQAHACCTRINPVAADDLEFVLEVRKLSKVRPREYIARQSQPFEGVNSVVSSGE